MAEKKVMLTQDGYDKLVQKLDYLKSVRKIEVADRLKAARALGDLSENSEYDDAKREQAFLEGEILDLETKIINSEIIQFHGGDIVDVGSTAVIREVEEASGKNYGKVNKIYSVAADGNPVEMKTGVSETEEIYKIIENDFKEIDKEKIYKLVNINVEDVTESATGKSEDMYRLIDGALIKFSGNEEEKTGKIYKITDGKSENKYGKIEQSYKVYEIVDEIEKYTIVGSTETNPDEYKISDESPLGSALMGKKVGTIVEVHAPVGVILYEIVDIES